MAENTFKTTMETLVEGIGGCVSTKMILGEPYQCDDMIIFPMAEMSFGVAAGSFLQEKKNNGTGGAGVKMSPSALLIVKDGTSKIVNIKDRNAINKLIDMIPDIMNKISEWIPKKGEAEEAAEE